MPFSSGTIMAQSTQFSNDQKRQNTFCVKTSGREACATLYVNASTRQASADDRSKKLTKFVKNVEIVEFHDHI